MSDELPRLIGLADDLRRPLERWDDARRRRHEAQVRHGLSGADAALAEEWQAMGDACECRQAIADASCLMLRLAVDIYPLAVRSILSEIVETVLIDELPSAVAAVLNAKGGR